RVRALGELVEDRGVHRFAAERPLEYLLVAPVAVRARGADLDLDAVQVVLGVDDEGAELAADLEHDGLRVRPVRMVMMVAHVAPIVDGRPRSGARPFRGISGRRSPSAAGRGTGTSAGTASRAASASR